jgi:hypothetical protein
MVKVGSCKRIQEYIVGFSYCIKTHTSPTSTHFKDTCHDGNMAPASVKPVRKEKGVHSVMYPSARDIDQFAIVYGSQSQITGQVGHKEARHWMSQPGGAWLYSMEIEPGSQQVDEVWDADESHDSSIDSCQDPASLFQLFRIGACIYCIGQDVKCGVQNDYRGGIVDGKTWISEWRLVRYQMVEGSLRSEIPLHCTCELSVQNKSVSYKTEDGVEARSTRNEE